MSITSISVTELPIDESGRRRYSQTPRIIEVEAPTSEAQLEYRIVEPCQLKGCTVLATTFIQTDGPARTLTATEYLAILKTAQQAGQPIQNLHIKAAQELCTRC